MGGRRRDGINFGVAGKRCLYAETVAFGVFMRSRSLPRHTSPSRRGSEGSVQYRGIAMQVELDDLNGVDESYRGFQGR
uniref:Uncharacterized protein n=1 Tax=Oryza brachyantha TaxID=4533 RepID=J3M061_ORYBR